MNRFLFTIGKKELDLPIIIALLILCLVAGYRLVSLHNSPMKGNIPGQVLTSMNEYGYGDSCVFVRDNMKRITTYLDNTKITDAILFGGDIFISLEDLEGVVVPSYESKDKYIEFLDVGVADENSTPEGAAIAFNITRKECTISNISNRDSFREIVDKMNSNPEIINYILVIEPNSSQVLCYLNSVTENPHEFQQVNEFSVNNWFLWDRDNRQLYIDIDTLQYSYSGTPTLPIKATYQNNTLYLSTKKPMISHSADGTSDVNFITEQAKDVLYSETILDSTFSICSSYTQEDYDYQYLKLQNLVDNIDVSKASLEKYNDLYKFKSDIKTEWNNLFHNHVDLPISLINKDPCVIDWPPVEMSDKEKQLYDKWQNDLLIKAIKNRKAVAKDLLSKSKSIGFQKALEEYCISSS